MKILGTFGKGLPGSISINFGQSGGRNCDRDGCRSHPKSKRADRVEGTPCYMVRLESLYTNVSAKLRDVESMPPARIVGQALVELSLHKRHIPWARISVGGSVPQPSRVRKDRLFRSQFRALCQWFKVRSIGLHFPVETYKKARFYRALVGDLVCVRESAQTVERFVKAKGAVSVYCGENLPRPLRVGYARLVAKKRTAATGRKTIVCPAITHNWAVRYSGMKPNPNAKCGGCTACADELVDIVYPKH